MQRTCWTRRFVQGVALELVAAWLGISTAYCQKIDSTEVDVAIQVCSLGKKYDVKFTAGVDLLKRRILSGEGELSESEIPSVIGSELQNDAAKIEIFKQIQTCVLGIVRNVIPLPPDSTQKGKAGKRVQGWMVTFSTSEAGGGAFRHFGSRGVQVPTPAAIDVRPYLRPDLSPRNVLVEITATTNHNVLEPGPWVYFVKLNGAPQSYTQCTNFEVQSDGIPIGGGTVPILSGQESSFDTPAKIEQPHGVHSLTIKLGCYFQARQFPVVTLRLKPPSGEWRWPTAGDFTVVETKDPNRPPDEQ